MKSYPVPDRLPKNSHHKINKPPSLPSSSESLVCTFHLPQLNELQNAFAIEFKFQENAHMKALCQQ